MRSNARRPREGRELPPAVIENPVLNSAYREPTRHFRFAEDGITNDVIEARRISSYFVPIPPPKKKGPQLQLPAEWTAERIQPNQFINQVRERLAQWRQGGRVGVTAVTRNLLDYWTREGRERRLFFCQIEALETAIYLTEVAAKHGDTWIENALRQSNESANPGLSRVAFKMATGSGKTVVMAMLIAWQSLNKLANPQDARFGDAFLVVTPGLTIRERLQVLLPSAAGNYYQFHDLVPPDELPRLQQARIHITNYHAFQRREQIEAASLTKKVLAGRDGDLDRFKETPGEMVRRVCRSLGTKRSIVVINDEAHHCYREKPLTEEEKLAAEERAEAKANAEAARIWLTGLEEVKKKIGVRAVYDLSATPFFLRGSGYQEGTLFPWVVSDFSLIDAIESGIVKVPRVPVGDDQVAIGLPTYRNLWARIRDDLPKTGRAAGGTNVDPSLLPAELEGALRSLYGHYEKVFRLWEEERSGTPPVFIVVCANTTVSKLVFDWIAGWEKSLPNGGSVVVPGNLPLFSNEDGSRWRDRPNAILIDSAQLESGEAMDDAFKRIAATEIDEFKREWRLRRGEEEITDEDLLREVMNTVGKPDRLGEQIRCVVSVAMLTEGWDANTVTHILGVRAFSTQLLCEQVIGRGLRRVDYATDEHDRFEPEYADVYGVPFSFIPTAGGTTEPKLLKEVHRVRALPERSALEITFPRVVGYRYDLPAERIEASFGPDAQMALSTADLPTETDVHPIVGEGVVHDLNELRSRRLQEVAFRIAQLTLDRHLRDPEGNSRPWLFPQLLDITKRWLDECVTCKDGAFEQMLILAQFAHDAAERIQRAIVAGTPGEGRLLPVLRSYDPVGSTAAVDFTTTKGVYTTDPTRCHLNYVVLDSNWEAKLADALERMPEVVCYVKNQGLGLQIPYSFEGGSANYIPDFIVRIDDGGEASLNVLLEVTGEKKKDKAAKVATAQPLWVPAVNAHGGSGRWAFLEVSDPWDAANLLRSSFSAQAAAVVV